MPDIPTYQSRVGAPQTSGLDPANPAIVGGGAIVQGFSNLASELLIRAAYDRQQDQIDQATAASKHLAGLVSEADTLWSEVQDAQRTNPADPRERQKTFQQALSTKIQAHIEAPDLQGSWAQKYFQAHLPTMLQSRLQTVHTETQNQLQRWQKFQIEDTLTTYADVAINDPAARSEAEKQVKALIFGMAVLGQVSDGPAEWSKWQANVAEQRGRAIVGAESQGFINAELSNTMPQFWQERGLNYDHFPKEVQSTLRTIAHEQNTLLIARNTADQQSFDKQLKDSYNGHKNLFLARHLDHEDAQGNRVPAEPVVKILADLTTEKSYRLLGDQWDSVHSFYVALDHHEKSGAGQKPSPADYNKVLKGIYTGAYTTPMSVLQAAAGLKFDITSTNEVLGKFETERGHVDTAAQQRVAQGLATISGRFALPGGAALDPADAIGRRNMVETRYFLWVEALKGQGGRALANADLIGTAQKLADQEYANMAAHVINIIPRTKASLVYDKASDVEADLKAGVITKHQADSYLQEIDQFQRLEIIGNTKKSTAGEAFK